MDEQGIVLPDDEDVSGGKSCSVIETNAEQDRAMQHALDEAVANPGSYNIFTRNCADFVTEILRTGGVHLLPHPFPTWPSDIYLETRVGAYINTGRPERQGD